MLAHEQGDYARARALAEESAACARQAGDEFALGRALLTLRSRRAPRVTAGRRTFIVSLELFEATGHRPGQAGILNGLGDLAQRADARKGVSLYRASLSLARETNHVDWSRTVLHNLGHIALQQGDLEGARTLHRGHGRQPQLGDRQTRAFCLVAHARVIAATGPPSRAATLLGAGVAQMEAAGVRLEPIDREPLERRIRAVREALGGTRFSEEFWDKGRSLTLDEALAAVERPLAEKATGGLPRPPGSRSVSSRCSAWLRTAASNQQIAASLYVSEHTVHRHLANIRRKLKLSSRAALAVHAARHGLALSRSLGWPERAIFVGRSRQ